MNLDTSRFLRLTVVDDGKHDIYILKGDIIALEDISEELTYSKYGKLNTNILLRGTSRIIAVEEHVNEIIRRLN